MCIVSVNVATLMSILIGILALVALASHFPIAMQEDVVTSQSES